MASLITSWTHAGRGHFNERRNAVKNAASSGAPVRGKARGTGGVETANQVSRGALS
jgi:hypothetical protein